MGDDGGYRDSDGSGWSEDPEDRRPPIPEDVKKYISHIVWCIAEKEAYFSASIDKQQELKAKLEEAGIEATYVNNQLTVKVDVMDSLIPEWRKATEEHAAQITYEYAQVETQRRATLNDFLLHDILSADRIENPKDTTFDLTTHYPDKTCFTFNAREGIKNVNMIAPYNEDSVLISIPVHSKRLAKLGDNPLEIRRTIEGYLENECFLSGGAEYKLVEVYQRFENRSTAAAPDEYLLSMSQTAFHDLAMATLCTLADSRQGARLFFVKDASFYQDQFKDRDSTLAQMVKKAVGYAKLTDADMAQLKVIATASQNFDFAARIKDAKGNGFAQSP